MTSRDLGQRRLPVEATWARFGYHPLRLLTEANDVFEIRVDEERGLVITTHTNGGLSVTDMDTEQLLWRLSPVSLSHSVRMNETELIHNVRLTSEATHNVNTTMAF